MILFNIIRKALQMERQYNIEEPMYKKYKFDDNYGNYGNYGNSDINEYNVDSDSDSDSEQIKLKQIVRFDLKNTENTENFDYFDDSDDFEDKLDFNISNLLKRKYSKIKLEYKSSGSNGVILYNESNPDYIYKVTVLYDGYDLNGINLLDCVYSNYFRINYPSETKSDYFPVQNISTEIITYGDFLNYYNIDFKTREKFRFVGVNANTDFIIINKMLNYDKSLGEYIKDKSNNIWNDFSIITKQLFKGINLFHQDNLVHGDLKTPNIMFDGIYCKLIDFGGVKSTDISYYSKSCTISTRPPEDLDWEHCQSDVSDKKYISSGIKGEMWSIGIILYELLTRTNGINDFYCKLFNAIHEIDRDKKELKIEYLINKQIKKHKQINFLNYIKKNNINQTDILLKLSKIEKLLYTNPEERVENIKTLYSELFNEELKEIKKINFRKIQLNNNSYRRIFNNYRKIVYPKLVNFIKKNHYMYGLEMMIDILDRYYCKKLNQSDSEIINLMCYKKEYTNENVLLISSALLISISIVYRKYWDIESFIKTLNKSKFSDIEFTQQDTAKIIIGIVKIFNVLSFDIINVKIDYKSNDEEIENKINKIIQLDY